MPFAASLWPMIIRLVVGIAVLAGFVWLIMRLIARMTGFGPQSPPGSEPADRTDDEEREIF